MKRSFLGLGIIGILFILFGTVFALQGDGVIGGSVMTGNPFWIYAGSGVVVVGLLMAVAGFYLGSRSKNATSTKKESGESTNNNDSTTSSSTMPNK